MQTTPSFPQNKQPHDLNQLMKALVRTMVGLYNDLTVAYTRDQTGRFFNAEEAEKADSEPAKWRRARDRFD